MRSTSHALTWLAFVGSCFSILPQITSAQYQDSTARIVSAHTSVENVVFGKNDSTLSVGEVALQFVAGEVAFNITSFAIGGDYFYRGSPGALGPSWGADLGLLAACFTSPLAIHLTTILLGTNTGDWGWAAAGSVFGVCLAGGIGERIPHQTYASRYFGLSLPLIALGLLVYDLTR